MNVYWGQGPISSSNAKPRGSRRMMGLQQWPVGSSIQVELLKPDSARASRVTRAKKEEKTLAFSWHKTSKVTTCSCSFKKARLRRFWWRVGLSKHLNLNPFSICLARRSTIPHQIARPPLSATHQYPACCLLPEGWTNTCCWQALPPPYSFPCALSSWAPVLQGEIPWGKKRLLGRRRGSARPCLLRTVEPAEGSSSSLPEAPSVPSIWLSHLFFSVFFFFGLGGITGWLTWPAYI